MKTTTTEINRRGAETQRPWKAVARACGDFAVQRLTGTQGDLRIQQYSVHATRTAAEITARLLNASAAVTDERRAA